MARMTVRVEINEAGYSKVADVLPPMRQAAKPAAAPNQAVSEDLPF